jgi:hypothetical protein
LKNLAENLPAFVGRPWQMYHLHFVWVRHPRKYRRSAQTLNLLIWQEPITEAQFSSCGWEQLDDQTLQSKTMAHHIICY